jgi:hypothetical protein
MAEEPALTRCTDVSPVPASETVRTEQPAAYQCATRRFELRLTTAELERWRAIAKRQEVSVADLVRAAVVIAGALPDGHVKRLIEGKRAERLDAETSAFAESLQHAENDGVGHVGSWGCGPLTGEERRVDRLGDKGFSR